MGFMKRNKYALDIDASLGDKISIKFWEFFKIPRLTDLQQMLAGQLPLL